MPIKLHKLDNGITLAYRHTSLPVGSIMLLYRTGSLEESAKYAGVTHLIEHLTFNCTGIPQLRLNSEFTRIGARYNAFTTSTCTAFWGYCGAKNLTVMHDLFMRMARKFELTPELLNEERDVVLAEIANAYNEPLSRFSDNFLMHVLPDSNYTNPVLGNEKALSKLTVNDVKYYHSRAFTTDRLIVVVQSPESELPKEILKSFDSLEPTSFRLDTTDVPRSEVLSGSAVYKEKLPTAESTLSMYAIPVSKDATFGSILDSAVSTSSDSYLYRKLRIDNQVAYDFGSTFIPIGEKALLVLEADHEPEYTDYVKNVLYGAGSFILEMNDSDFSKYRESRENRYLLDVCGYTYFNDLVIQYVMSQEELNENNIDPDINTFENFRYGDFRKFLLDTPEKGYYGAGGPEVSNTKTNESYKSLRSVKTLRPHIL